MSALATCSCLQTASEKTVMSVVELRAIKGGAVPEDTLLKAAPDGMCAASCVVSGFNVAEYLAVPRNHAGFARDLSTCARGSCQ